MSRMMSSGGKVRGLVWCRGAVLPCGLGLLQDCWWWGANEVGWLENEAALGVLLSGNVGNGPGRSRHVVTVRERRIGGQGLSGGERPLSR